MQFKLLRLAAHHPETKKADLAVLAEVIQRYHGQYGNGFVSDEEICALTSLCDRTVGRARQRLTRLGFIDVVRAGTRGHATVYVPNFSLVPEKGDSAVTERKGDIQVHEMDPSVTISAEYGDSAVTPSYLQTGLQAGHLIDRLDSAPATPPRAAGLAPAAGEAPEEELNLHALITAYAPADMSRPARMAYKRAWEAITGDTDLGAVIDGAADWHQSWAQQNDPNAPRMGLVRWLKDEMWLKPAPRGFNKVERPAKTKAGKSATPAKRKPTAPITARITAAHVVTLGFGSSELRFSTDDGTEHVVVLEHPNENAQSEGQLELRRLVYAVGLQQIADSGDLLGRTIKLVGGEERFAAPDSRPDDDPPPPVRPEPARYANPDPQPAPTPLPPAPSDWPEWMDAEYEDDDAA